MRAITWWPWNKWLTISPEPDCRGCFTYASVRDLSYPWQNAWIMNLSLRAQVLMRLALT